MFGSTIERALETAVADDSMRGIHRLTGDTFTAPEIFDLEMQYIFEANWIYLAHESQILERNGHFGTYLGRQPALITRTRNRKLNAFVTPFGQHSHALSKLARFESYRGFLFGSLNSEVAPLADHLGDAAKIIDLIVDQSPEGLEVLRGTLTCRYERNWKQPQGANGADGGIKQGGRFYRFENGHLLLSSYRAGLTDRQSWSLCLYPNLLLMEQQICHYRPIAVDQTKVTSHSLAPKGESTPMRIRRIRQYEDFCNVEGMVTWEDQAPFAIQHEYWRYAMRRALAAERRL